MKARKQHQLDGDDHEFQNAWLRGRMGVNFASGSPFTRPSNAMARSLFKKTKKN
jgi:hypothetical protein